MLFRICSRTAWKAARLGSRLAGEASLSSSRFGSANPCWHRLSASRQGFWSIRTLSSVIDKESAQSVAATREFTPVYICNFIVHLKVLSRFKIYQTALTCMGYPPLAYLYSTGAVSLQSFSVASGVAGVACLMLYVMSAYIMRIVGMISINKDESLVRVSHLSFWGKRRDLVVKPDEIVPLSDLSNDAPDVYRLLKFYSSTRTLYFFQRFGRIDDIQALEKVLGTLK